MTVIVAIELIEFASASRILPNKNPAESFAIPVAAKNPSSLAMHYICSSACVSDHASEGTRARPPRRCTASDQLEMCREGPLFAPQSRIVSSTHSPVAGTCSLKTPENRGHAKGRHLIGHLRQKSPSLVYREWGFSLFSCLISCRPAQRSVALIGAIVLGLEAKIDWGELLEDQKRFKHQMEFDRMQTGRGRPHIEWRW